MELVRAVNAAAKILLAHFHYCCKGQVPFSKDFDWSSPTNTRMAHLDAEQFDFMCNYVRAVHERGKSSSVRICKPVLMGE
jgi:hypothetical protein